MRKKKKSLQSTKKSIFPEIKPQNGYKVMFKHLSGHSPVQKLKFVVLKLSKDDTSHLLFLFACFVFF
jgi:hypothetical protein